MDNKPFEELLPASGNASINMLSKSAKKQYNSPKFSEFGRVRDLTTGSSNHKHIENNGHPNSPIRNRF